MVKVVAKNYLNSNDIETEVITNLKVVQISDGSFDCCEKRPLPDGSERFILYTEYGDLVLNLTNIETLNKGFKTNESKEWLTHKVKIVKEKTEFKGKKVDCLRVYPVIQTELDSKTNDKTETKKSK